ncbi:MAG: nucleotidyltransferase domain-containing protein [Armatimonadetes bacterium]|nr:nucleotidyltransferase domain-containing protein [Armatimonadota bacterium]
MSDTLQVIPKPQLDRILQELREGLEALYGDRLKGLYLFGSYARGEAEPGSDIDVAVVLEGEVDVYEEVERTGDVVSRLSLQTDTFISLMFVPREGFEARATVFLTVVNEEGVAV